MSEAPDDDAVSIEEISLGNDLSPDQCDEMRASISAFTDVWDWKEDQLNVANAFMHPMDRGDTERLSKHEEEIVDADVSKWLQQAIVEPSQSPWASPVVSVPKQPLDPDDKNEKPK